MAPIKVDSAMPLPAVPSASDLFSPFFTQLRLLLLYILAHASRPQGASPELPAQVDPFQDLCTIYFSLVALINVEIFHLFQDYLTDVSLGHQPESPQMARISLLCSQLYAQCLAQPLALRQDSFLGKKTQVTILCSAPSILVS